MEAWAVEFPLREPYQIAYEQVDRAVNVFLRIITNSHLVGLGCSAPDIGVTGETAVSVVACLNHWVAPRLQGEDPTRIRYLLSRIKPQLIGRPSVLAAVDLALCDLLGKVAGLPLWRLWGGYRNGILTSVTIPILPMPATLSMAKRFADEGFRSLKLKGGLDWRDDAERVLAVRALLGPQMELRFDANQGYGIDETCRFAAAVATAALTVLEQPTPRDRPDMLIAVRDKIPMTLMADESLMNAQDAFHLSRHQGSDGFNVKIMKVGGIHEAQRIIGLAEAAGNDVMIGCMDEVGLGIAAGLAVALARPGVTMADLDGFLDLLGDPTRAAIRLRNGVLYPSPLPGLGLATDLYD